MLFAAAQSRTQRLDQLRVERLFLSRPIQDILIEKFIVRNKSIEAKKRWHAVDPKIALLTDNEVKELERRQNSEIFVSTCKLSPFRFPKVCETKIIQKDPELNNWFSRVKCDHKFALVDLSKNQPPFKRKCFIREMNGELRTTGLDEKYKLLNIFYPRDEYVYKFPILPKYLAHNELLDKMLHKKSYEYLLDSLVYFLRPEQERFCQLLSKIYDVIIDRQDYGCIEHSRHFGSFIFYSIVTKKYAEFIMSLANRNMADCLKSFLRLHCLIHGSKSGEENVKDLLIELDLEGTLKQKLESLVNDT